MIYKKKEKRNYVLYLILATTFIIGVISLVSFRSSSTNSTISGSSNSKSSSSRSFVNNKSNSHASSSSSSSSTSTDTDGDQCLLFSPLLHPLHFGKHRVWTSISKDLSLKSPESPTIALLFHGCSHSGEVWATGTEEKMLVQSLLDQSIHVIAPSSESGRLKFQANNDGIEHSGCWNTGPDSDDVNMVAEIVKTLSEITNTTNFIRYIAIGASSGGFFTSYLSTILSLHGIGVYISPLHPLLSSMFLTTSSAFSSKFLQDITYPKALPLEYRAKFIPKRIALVSMPRDAYTETALSRSIEDLLDTVSTDSIKRFSQVSRPISLQTFSDIMPWLLSPAASERLFTRLPTEYLSPVAPIDITDQQKQQSNKEVKSSKSLLWLLEDARAIPHFASAVDAWIKEDLIFSVRQKPHFTLKSESKKTSTDDKPSKDTQKASLRILRRNVLEILQERFAVHEMSSQFASEIVKWLVAS